MQVPYATLGGSLHIPLCTSLKVPSIDVTPIWSASTRQPLALALPDEFHGDQCYDFPFHFPFHFHFTLLFDPHSILFHLDCISLPFLHHLSTRLSLFPLSMTHKPLRLTSSSIPTLPYTARHCLMTHTDSLSPQGCASPLFPFHMTSYDSTLIFYQTTVCPTIYI